MAERRMFAKTIIDSDAFLDMPLSAQALYFHLSMRADDEGFLNNPKKIQRMINATEDDLKLLIMKSFIIPFESGVVVIKHWKIHNYIRGDRLVSTQCVDEKKQLSLKDNGAYELSDDLNEVGEIEDKATSENQKEKSIQEQADAMFARVWSMYPFKKSGRSSVKPATKRRLFTEVGEEQLIRCLERFKQDMIGRDSRYIVIGSTFFNTRYADYLDENYKETMNIPIVTVPEGISERQARRELQ